MELLGEDIPKLEADDRLLEPREEGVPLVGWSAESMFWSCSALSELMLNQNLSGKSVGL